MKLSHFASAAAMSLAMVSGAALAAPQINITSALKIGNVPNFGGIDYAVGAAWTTGIVAAEAAGVGGSFVINFAGLAGALTDPAQANIGSGVAPGLANLDSSPDGAATNANSFEITTYASINVTIVGVDPGLGLTSYVITGGSYKVWYDETPDALTQDGAWSGFNGGDFALFEGTFTGVGGVFLGAFNSGSFNVTGTVDAQSSIISPELASTEANPVGIRFVFSAADPFNIPTSVDGAGIGQDENVFATDVSQLVFPVPEPSALLLAGLGLILAARRSTRKVK